tara:strand:+ start:1003 stop:1407 length:405 start_codon:yes stop_codon:yes gene_type:complete
MAIEFLNDANIAGELNYQKSGFTTITHSSNTHTVDFSAKTNNYSITATNAANTITWSNLGAGVVGKAGTITVTNPSSVGSLSFAALPATAYVPGASEISFHTGANAIAVLSYFIIASDKVLINYVGAFGAYPQP